MRGLTAVRVRPDEAVALARLRAAWRRPAALSLVALVGLVVLALRRPGSVTHPALWAEDGSVFFHDAMVHSFPSTLTSSYAGYLHLVPRLLSAVAARLPLAWTPTVYAVSSLLLATLAMTPSLSSRLEWLIPSRSARVALFAALILLPSVDEVSGGLDDLHWYFGITLVMLALSCDPRSRPGKVVEACVLSVLGLTGPFSILTAPIFWVRAWRERTRHSVVVALLITATAAVQGAVLVTSHDPGNGTGAISIGAFTTAWGLRLGGTAVFGEKLLHDLWVAGLLHGGAFWLASCGFLALAATCLVRLPRTAALTVLVAMAAAVASTTLRLRSDLVGLENPADGGRYYVIPMGLLAITLVAALSPPLLRRVTERTRASLLLGVIPCALFLQAMVFDARLPARADIHWADTVKCVQQHRSCVVRLDPSGWTTQLPPL